MLSKFTILAALIPCLVEAHVRLDFPVARRLALDFLDNVRTRPPCGMPKGESLTTLESGASINVTWHLSYPHQGSNNSFSDGVRLRSLIFVPDVVLGVPHHLHTYRP